MSLATVFQTTIFRPTASDSYSARSINCISGAAVASAVFKSGDIVPHTGVYRVEHHLHRLMHEATLEAGICFPLCRKCRAGVTFSSSVPYMATYRPSGRLTSFKNIQTLKPMERPLNNRLRPNSFVGPNKKPSTKVSLLAVLTRIRLPPSSCARPNASSLPRRSVYALLPTDASSFHWWPCLLADQVCVDRSARRQWHCLDDPVLLPIPQ